MIKWKFRRKKSHSAEKSCRSFPRSLSKFISSTGSKSNQRGNVTLQTLKQAEIGQSRRHIQGSKIAKGLPRVNLQYSKIEKAKNGPSGTPESASASPWRAKRGTLPKLSTFFCRSWRGDPLEKKQIYEKSHNVEKLKGGPFRIFQHPFWRKTAKKIEGGTLWAKKFPEKSRSAEKNWKGGPSGLARYGMLRGKTGKTFLVQFTRLNGAIIFCRTFKNYFGQFVWIEKKSLC